jgi:hypothetical protein
MVNRADIGAAVEAAARAETAGLAAGDRHVPKLRVKVPPDASRTQLEAAVRSALADALGKSR